MAGSAALLLAQPGSAATAEPWWQHATGYQIYPMSFCDSNGDGMGDIPGILSKIDYLGDLGIGFIWLSPVYASPMVDNGYDISDYQAVNPRFGTLADLDRLIAAARARGIGIVMDLVVNHTSDQHAWFKSARTSRTAPFRDFYIWRDPAPGGGPPNDMQSAFGGPAWTLDPATRQYYFHMFAAGQPDLNWSNPRLRHAVYDMMNWWLDRGIAGFRMDVIELIGKDVDRKIGANGPKLHDYLQEMHRAALAGRDCLTVGETWSSTPQIALLYSGRQRHELSMVFQFEHIQTFWDPKGGKWQPKPVDLRVLKRIFNKWQTGLAHDGWNSLFWSNHDLPRAVSRFGNEGPYRVESAKMLGTVLHMMKGTPYIYQGEELGMTNAGFTRISQYRDIETLNAYRAALAAGTTEAAFLAGARASSRDNARTPMQWNASPGAGFSTGTPWIEVNPNHVTINAAAEEHDPDSVLAHYRKLVALRKQHALIRQGEFTLLAPEDPAVFAYERRLNGKRLVVVANFTADETVSPVAAAGMELISNQPVTLAAGERLGAYQVVVVMG
jgi:oligo-1,6-glucosidase